MDAKRGFTLTDLLIVVAILLVLAGLVFSQYRDGRHNAELAALQANVRLLQQRVEYHTETHGRPPETLDPSWFPGDALPAHPQNRWPSLPTLEVVTGPEQHPEAKVLKPPDRAAYWYNADLGVVRARVAKMPGHKSNTLTFYNTVNGSEETDLGPLGN